MYAIIEIIFSIAIFINAALFVPQIIKIWRHKSAKEVSLFTFAGFSLIQLAIIAYGVIHRDWLLVIGTGLSLLTCGTVTILTLIFK